MFSFLCSHYISSVSYNEHSGLKYADFCFIWLQQQKNILTLALLLNFFNCFKSVFANYVQEPQFCGCHNLDLVDIVTYLYHYYDFSSKNINL